MGNEKIEILLWNHQPDISSCIVNVFRSRSRDFVLESADDYAGFAACLKRRRPQVLLVPLDIYREHFSAAFALPMYDAVFSVLLLCPAGRIAEAENCLNDDRVTDYFVLSEESLPALPHAVERLLSASGRSRACREQALWEALEKKDVFLKELYHRVKNNFQTICSMLSLQSQHLNDEKILSLFTECQDRVRAMALVHERLQNSPDLISIDFREYVNNLIKGLFWSYSADHRRISTCVDIDEVDLEMDTCIICGLIINELVSNALKYAFAAKESDGFCISVRLRADASSGYTLEIEDNGIGLPAVIDMHDPASLGLQLVVIFARDQLNGTISVVREQGTLIRIQF